MILMLAMVFSVTSVFAITAYFLEEPESGWQRFNNTDSSISYSGTISVEGGYSTFHLGDFTRVIGSGGIVQFSFTGTKIRILVGAHQNCAPSVDISLDGTDTENVFTNITPVRDWRADGQMVIYERTNLVNGIHSIKMTVLIDHPEGHLVGGLAIDAIDIDSSGSLMPYTETPTPSPELCSDFSIVGSLGAYNPGLISSNTQKTQTYTVTGAQLGDLVQVSFDKDLQGVNLFGYISAANQITVVFQNKTDNNISLAPGIIRIRLSRHTKG